MATTHVTLHSSSLLSKWGFEDGESPEDWLDYCDANSIQLDFPLIRIVRQYLLPALDQAVTLVEIETCHNPIRAHTVDGRDMTEVWYGRAPEPTLTPESIQIPMAEVLHLALLEAGLIEPLRHLGRATVEQPRILRYAHLFGRHYAWVRLPTGQLALCPHPLHPR